MPKPRFGHHGLHLLIGGLAVSTPLLGSTVNWTAQSPDNDMNNAANWTPHIVPDGEGVVFDSSVSNIATDPTQASADFSVDAFNFPHDAAPFTITIDGHTLLFDGSGILGTKTDTTIEVTNANNSTALGPQVSFTFGGTLGGSSLNVTNIAIQTGSVSGATLSPVGGQFSVPEALTMASGSSLSLFNAGVDTTSGTGGNVSANVTSDQATFSGTLTVGDDVAISVGNDGFYSGTSSSGNSVGLVQGYQCYNGGVFTAGDSFHLSIENFGSNSSTSEGDNFVGTLSQPQAKFNSDFIIGEQGRISILNEGVNNTLGGAQCFTGSIVGYQFYTGGQFTAGDDLSVTIDNLGSDNSGGEGQGYTSTIDTPNGSQFEVEGVCFLGQRARISVHNTGVSTGGRTRYGATVAALNQDQVFFSGPFQAGDSLNISVTNSGEDSSHNTAVDPFLVGNVIGGASEYQLGFGSSCVVGDSTTLSISNSRNFSGSNTIGGTIGSVPTQFFVGGSFQSRDSFSLQVENVGVDTGSGVGAENIAVLQGGQANLSGTCTLGNSATVSISNSGSSASTSTGSGVGYVNASQVDVVGAFSAGTGLNMSISNAAVNAGDPGNVVGVVSGAQAEFHSSFSVGSGSMVSVSNQGDVLGNAPFAHAQLGFDQAVTLGNGSLISASNSGVVGGSQLLFSEGFTVSSGNATIRATNSGTVGVNGISILGANGGGNANVVLENATAVIDTSLATFTIGELNGDGTSTMQSHAPLVIATDRGTQGDFSGDIQDFPSVVSTLIKDGPGSQKLSGVNSYTGLTSIDEGILSITGSIVGDATANSGGTLRGTGTIGGLVTVADGGTLYPGNSIGTITLGSLVLDSGATTEIEVTPTASSLVHVVGSAAIDGALQIDAECDFYGRGKTYTIVDAETLTGTFSSVNQPFSRYESTLTYLPDAVELTLSPIYFTDVLRNASCACSNTFQIADYLDCLYFDGFVGCSGDLFRVFNVINAATVEQLQIALSQLHPAPYDAMIVAQQYSSLNYMDTLLDRLDQVRTLACYGGEGCVGHAWITPFGSIANQDCVCDQLGYHDSEKGISLGYDGRWGNRWILGASVGYATTELDWTGGCATAGLYSTHASLYGRMHFPYVYIDLGLSVAGDWFKSGRAMQLASSEGVIERIACSRVKGGEVDLHVGVGLQTQNFPVDLTLVGSVDYIHMHRGAFAETGAKSLNLTVQGAGYNFARYELGLWASKCLRSWVPQLGLAVAYDSRSQAPIHASFADECGSGCSMNVYGLAPNRFLVIPKAKITQVFADRFSIALSYEGDFASDYSENSLWLALGCDF